MQIRVILFLAVALVFFGCKNRKTTKLLEHANSEFMVQNYESSIGLYDQCLEIDPNHAVALMNKSLASIQLQDLENAMLNLDLLLSINPNHVKATYQKAMCLYQLGMYAESHQLFIKLLGNNNFDQGELYHYMALCQYSLGNNIQALQDFNQIALNSRYKKISNLWSGLIYESLTDWKSAINKYKENIELGELTTEIYYRLGICYSYLENNYYAKYYFSSAIQKDPRYTNAYLQRGLIHFKLKYFDAAIFDYNNVLEQDSTHLINALKGRTASLLMKKQVHQAYTDVNKLNELVPDDPLVLSLTKAFTALQNDTINLNSFFATIEKELSEPFAGL